MSIWTRRSACDTSVGNESSDDRRTGMQRIWLCAAMVNWGLTSSAVSCPCDEPQPNVSEAVLTSWVLGQDYDSDGVNDLALVVSLRGTKDRNGAYVVFVSTATSSILGHCRLTSDEVRTYESVVMIDDHDSDGLKDFALGSPEQGEAPGEVIIVSPGSATSIHPTRPTMTAVRKRQGDYLAVLGEVGKQVDALVVFGHDDAGACIADVWKLRGGSKVYSVPAPLLDSSGRRGQVDCEVDLNKDGYTDIILGGKSEEHGSGQVTVYDGRSGAILSVLHGTDGRFGVPVLGVPALEARGPQILVGRPCQDGIDAITVIAMDQPSTRVTFSGCSYNSMDLSLAHVRSAGDDDLYFVGYPLGRNGGGPSGWGEIRSARTHDVVKEIGHGMIGFGIGSYLQYAGVDIASKREFFIVECDHEDGHYLTVIDGNGRQLIGSMLESIDARKYLVTATDAVAGWRVEGAK
jgi:hypothetical protein